MSKSDDEEKAHNEILKNQKEKTKKDLKVTELELQKCELE